MEAQSNIVATQVNRTGQILLDRPEALHALTYAMIGELDRQLQQWAVDESVEAVVVRGAGERAFCAGGDVKSIRAAGLSERKELTVDFFRAEYSLNYRIGTYPKPYVAILDGITMGGGAGISVMGSHRIATDRTTFAMPETIIGFFADVGGSYFLSRLGPIGRLLALTGTRIDGATTAALGLASHFVPSHRCPQLVDQMATEGVASAIETMAESPPPSERLPVLRRLADLCFTDESMESILDSLSRVSVNGDGALATEAQALLDMLGKCSPLSLKVTLEELRRGETMSFKDCLIMEFRLSQSFIRRSDFFEGVRAALVNKDRQPNWQPDRLSQVSPELVASYFDKPAAGDLPL